jgi:phosphodiesterase/alkaline phosphatase D-like protein
MDRALSKFAMDRALIERMTSLARAVVPRWRSVAAVALLSILLGVVLSGNAHATLTPDGLLAGESGEEGHFGQSVALSADGNTALVGAPTGNGEAGAVLVFTRTGSTWTQQAELTPKGGEESGNGEFGASVAVSADGNTAIVGAPADSLGAGAAWVFTRSPETGAWTQQGAKLTPEVGEESLTGAFGSSVALSSEGSTALIGGHSDNGEVGAAWVFTRSEAGAWTQQGKKLTAKAGEETGSGAFGSSVALSKDGDTALIGAPGDSGNAGAAWVFTRSEGGAWSQQGEKLTGGGEVGEASFGSSVALSKNGDTALIGGPADGEPVRGAAWVFTRSEAGAWSQQGEKLTAKAGEESEQGAFGSSVALSSDGNTALIGGPGDNEDTGAAWMLARSSEGVWAQEGAKLAAKTGEESEKGAFGSSVALSSDGYTELAGGPADNTNTGAVWAFVNPPTVSGVSPDRGPEAGGSSVTITGTNLDEAAAVTFGSSGATSFEVISPTSITAIAPAGTSTVDVIVTTSGGASATSSADKFSYVPAPTVVTKAAASITQTTATLNATVNPNGGEVTNCKFEYGTTEFYGSSLPCSSLPGPGSSPVAVSAALESLSADTTYHFRIVATNLGGTSTDILNAQTFETLPDAPTVVTEEATSITQTTATLNATVNPHGGEVTSCKVDYGTTETYGKSAPCSSLPGSGSSPVAVSAAVTGLSANTTYHFRVVATNSGGTTDGADQTFKTPPNPPTVVTKAASSITQTTATLNATVNPNGGSVSSCELEYGPTESYGSSAACSPSPGSGGSPVGVSAAVTGLSANTTYHFRVVATNAGGAGTGSDGAFKTLPNPPTVVTGSGSPVAQTTATLNATVNPNGGEVTSCEFEYGTTETYGKSAPCSSLPGSGSSPVAVSAAVAGLGPNTTYHFRVVATNPGGTSSGADQTFKTLPNAPTVATKAASSIAQTTAMLNATVNPNGGEVSSCKFEYGTSEAYGSSVPCTPLSPGSGTSAVAVSAAVVSLGANTTYHFRVVAANTGGTSSGADQTFKTLPNPPTVVTQAASSITQTTVTLNATVNPNGGSVSSCELEYGPTESYGSSAACSPSPGSGSSPVGVSAAVTGLSANTTYHLRIVATNAGGTGTGGDEAFKTLPNPPTVSNVKPNKGPEAGGTTVTITGTNLGEDTAVKFGSTAASSVTADSGTSITAVSPAGTGTVDVTVSTAGGTSHTNTGDQFSYVPPPAVTGVSPNAGPLTAGTSVTITGTNLNEATAVKFGSTSATSYKVSSETSITAVAPAGTGTVDVTVSTVGGTSATGSSDKFTYVPPPTVTGVNPNAGPLAGGNSVTITGTNFTSNTEVKFGSTSATGVKVTSPTALTVVSAAGTGTVNVTVITPGGTSALSAADEFSYPGPPTIEMEAPTAIGQTSAILRANLNPKGGVITQCYFHYERVVPAPGETPVITPCVGLPISGKKPMPVSALAGAEEGLSAATSYRFSIEVINSFDETAFSPLPESEPPQFKTLPGPEVVTGVAASVTQTSATLNATVNPNGGEVSDCHFEYGATESYGSTAKCTPSPGSGTSPVGVSASVTGLIKNTTYYFRIVATNPGGESQDTLGQKFTTLPDPPVVVTAAASSPTQTSATLNGTVNPNGGTVSDCHFEYGTSTSYGSSVSCSSLPGSGESPVAVSAALEGLNANTTYHFRAVATNAGGPSLPGADQTFTTPPNAPTVVTEKASSITQTAATLNAIVNPNGGPVSDCKLEYGSSASYGSSVSCTPSPGSGNSAVAVSASLGALSANTTYHFRIVATNPGGARSGGDQSFTTVPVPVPPATKTTEAPLATTMTKTETTTTTTSSTTSSTPVATCRVSLASTSVMTQAGGMAAIKLIWTGTAASTCSGKLTLTVKTKGKSKRSKPTLIATGNFSLPLGKTQIARVKLNEAGRALLNAGHGRLSANLAILELFPDPSPAQTETIHLVQEARSSSKRKK